MCGQAVEYENMQMQTCTVSALAQRQVPLRWVADEIMMEMWLSILRPDRYQMRYNRGAVWERILLRRERERGSHWCPSAWIPSLNRSLCPAWRSVSRCFRAEQGWHTFSTKAWAWVAGIAMSRGRSSRCLEQGEGFPFWVPRRPEAS